MNIKLVIAASFLCMSVAGNAFAAEGNNEPFPLSLSIGADSQTRFSTLADANGLPVGALNGTPFYKQAQSVTQWDAQQADRRLAQQQAAQAPRG